MEANGGILALFIKKIYESKLEKYKKNVDTHLQQIIDDKASDPQINTMLHYAIESGRRFRPLLFLLAHKIFKRELTDNVYQLAAAIELLHKASLIHDDFLDGDEFRRGKASFYHTYSARTAVITGDLLVSLAFEQYAACATDPYLTREWAKLYRLLAMGEMQDLVWEGNWQVNDAQLHEMIYGKTASFLEFALLAGSYLACQDENVASKMGQLGKEVGFAFQIMNDLNNWYGLEKELGRNPEGDILAGKVNPVTLLVRRYQQTAIANQGNCGNCGNGDNSDNSGNVGNGESCGKMTNESPDTRLSAELREKIVSEVKATAALHILKARQALESVGVKNQYSQVLHHLLNEFDQKWFWVDRDDQ